MRTRFLTPDYFTAATQSVNFLRFPLSPHPSTKPVSSHNNSNRFPEELLRGGGEPVLENVVSVPLPEFPIDDALSKFYSDVLPHTIDVERGGDLSNFGNDHVPEEWYNVERGGDQSSYRSDTSGFQVPEDRSGDAVEDKIESGAVIVQFETPELAQYVENACMFEKENMDFLSEVQECDDDLEMLNLLPSDPFGLDTKDPVNPVESICLEYDMVQKLQIPDEVDLLLKNSHVCDTVFPLLEVDEIGPTDVTWACIEIEWHSLLETIGKNHPAGHADLGLSCQDLLVSVKLDILEHISDCHTSKFPLETLLTNLNLAVDIDLSQLLERPYTEGNTGTEDAFPIPFAEAYLFEEFEMLDSDSFDIFEALAISQTASELGACDQLFHPDLHFKSFDELIVSPELMIIDGTFTSLPVPVILDDEKVRSVEVIFDEMVTGLEPLPFSTSDEIYLDWYLLGNEKCNDDVNAAIQKVFSDAEDYSFVLNLKPSDCSMLVLDFILSDDPFDGLSTRENKLDMPSGGSCRAEQLVNQVGPSRVLDDDCLIIKSVVKMTDVNAEKVASGSLSDDDCQIIETKQMLPEGRKVAPSLESVPQVNDLDFFLNPRKATGGMRIDHRAKPPPAKPMLSGSLKNEATTAISSGIQMQHLDIRLHRVTLPDHIIILIDSLRRSYLAIFRYSLQRSNTEFPSTSSDAMTLLGLSEEKLLDHFSRSSQRKSCTGYRDDNAIEFVILSALKRMTWCLCFRGIYSLHLFWCKLLQSQDFLKAKLCFLSPLIEDAYAAVDKEITMSHPSLAIIKEILQQNNCRDSKVLILAQQDLWEPLKRLLDSMNILCTEIVSSTLETQKDLCYDFFAGGLRDHLQTACLLLQHEHISPFILRQNFGLVVEYGGPCVLSKVSTLHPDHIGSRTLHFLKVELDDVTKALCDGIVATSDKDTVELEELLNFRRLTGNFNVASSEISGSRNTDNLPTPVVPMPQVSIPVQTRDLSFRDMVIIVNTQNFDKEMILSRRSTYQKILGMEKMGVQVVERDLILPVDIILDATTCVVWYDCKSIGKKATTQDEGSSSIPLCIENIATNVLTSLSFSFTACVLVFEGESNFLSTVMESADELYAAAASLGTNLQIFCSYSIELTDEIILNSIGHTRKFFKGLLPRLPETETLAESFLTKFPSVNPLSANAIFSCGCMLLEFLEWSADSRIHALRKYHLPEESVNLLSVLCKYGEREETKSGVTDCSSSVSSPPDSGHFVRKVSSEDRKRKFNLSSSDAMDDFRCSMPPNKHTDEDLSYCGRLRPSDSKVSKSARLCLEEELPGFLLGDALFGKGDGPSTGASIDLSRPWSELNPTGTPNIPNIGDGFGKSTLPVKDRFFSQQKSGGTENKREGRGVDLFQDLHEDFVGEVVDIYDKSPFDVDFQAAERDVKSAPMLREVVKDHAPNYGRAARRLSFGSSSYLNFSTADEVNTGYELEDNSQMRADNDYHGLDYNWSNSCFSSQQEMQATNKLEKSVQSFSGPILKEKDVPPYGETPLTKAVHSSQLRQGSPWTIEFLNRIKEKRRLRQQCQPLGSSIPHSSNYGNIAKGTKRRSPSILEYYKYQGGSHGSTPRKVAQQNMRNQHSQPRNEKPSEFRPCRTPIDKRARRSLSFATSGTGSQTKLVWGDNISCSQASRFC